MSGVADKIMKVVKASGRGAKVYTPKDFLTLGSRSAVDKALSRLAAAGTLRRVGRGLYDWPRHSDILDRDAPADLNAVVAAVKRAKDVEIAPSNLAAANAFGLTHAVSTRTDYVASKKLADVKVAGHTIRFRDAGPVVSPWLGTPAAPVVQALCWMHDANISDAAAINTLRQRSSATAKRSLKDGLSRLPAWAIPIARQITARSASRSR